MDRRRRRFNAKKSADSFREAMLNAENFVRKSRPDFLRFAMLNLGHLSVGVVCPRERDRSTAIDVFSCKPDNIARE